MQFTFQNLNLANPADVDQACKILRSFATVPAEMLASTSVITITLEANGYITDSPVAPIADAESVSTLFQGQTRAFLERMIDSIRSKGGVTLKDAATMQGIGIDTARAYLRNAGRTAKAHGVAMPIVPKWDADKGCNVYGV